MKNSYWKVVTVTLAVLLALSSSYSIIMIAQGSSPTVKKSEKPTVTFLVGGGGNPTFFPTFFVAWGIGAFDAVGLNVKALAAGQNLAVIIGSAIKNDTQFVFTGTAVTFNATRSGNPVKMIYITSGGTQSAQALLISNDLKQTIKSVSDLPKLNGTRCSGSIPGTGTDIDLLYYEKIFKFNCIHIPITSYQTMAGQLGTGTLKLIVLPFQYSQPTVDAGLGYYLLDPRNATHSAFVFGKGRRPPGAGMWGLSSYLDSHRDVVQKVVNAMIIGDAWMGTHSLNQTAEVLARSPMVGGTMSMSDILSTLKTSFVPGQWGNSGYLSATDWANIKDYWSARYPYVDSPDFNYPAILDNTFVQNSPFYANHTGKYFYPSYDP